MANARGSFEWAQTSWVLSMLFNANRDPKTQPALKPDDFNPYAAKAARPTMMTAPLASLLSVIIGKGT